MGYGPCSEELCVLIFRSIITKFVDNGIVDSVWFYHLKETKLYILFLFKVSLSDNKPPVEKWLLQR